MSHIKDEIHNVKMNIKGLSWNKKILPSNTENQFNDTAKSNKTINTETDYQSLGLSTER